MIVLGKQLLYGLTVFICSYNWLFANHSKTEYNSWKLKLCKAVPQYAEGFHLSCKERKLELTIKLTNQKPVKIELIPRDRKTSRNQLAIPIDSYASLSATHVSHLKKLNTLNKMVGFSRIQDLTETSLLKRHEQGTLKELGMIQNLRIETILELNPEVIFGYHFSGIENQLKNLSKTGTKIVYINEYLESSPLAYAEWIKLFGILFDKAELANAGFNKIRDEYLKLSAMATREVTKPSVLVNIPYGSTWFVPAGDNFMAHLIRDAGGRYIFANTTGNFNLKLSLEAVIESGLKADYWLNPGQHTHKSSLLKEDSRFALFKAYETGHIFNNTKAELEQRTNDYFSRGLSNPQLLLADLVKILHPHLLADHELEWFHSLRD
tara:strand:- start:763 stop:1899 length:1137 start_codon:yes stop_codon:yes gene_type:complete